MERLKVTSGQDVRINIEEVSKYVMNPYARALLHAMNRELEKAKGGENDVETNDRRESR